MQRKKYNSEQQGDVEWRASAVLIVGRIFPHSTQQSFKRLVVQGVRGHFRESVQTVPVSAQGVVQAFQNQDKVVVFRHRHDVTERCQDESAAPTHLQISKANSQSINQSTESIIINQSINQSIELWINQSIDESGYSIVIKQSIDTFI